MRYIKLFESYEQEPDKDWSVNSKGSSKVNRFHFDNGFLSDEEGLRERVRDIFIELEDTSHDVTIDIDKLSISVFIDASDTIVRAGTNYSPINNELNEYSIDYDLTKDCCETFVEYIKDRNPNVDSRLGLNTKYTIEYYDLEKGSGTKSRHSVQEFEALRDHCIEEGILFEDPTFPADDSSLYYSRRAGRQFRWLRPQVSNLLIS